uniref:Serine-rich protein-like protein n=1 Tax=Cucumis melo TaxID=3656 RepID=A0A9I9CJK2_CUCME
MTAATKSRKLFGVSRVKPAAMASDGSLGVSVSTSPKHANRDAETMRSSSPKGQCLCSPTMHQGSFRCRLHRSTSSAWMKRSKSMPANNPVASLSPKGSLGSS